jgi:GT2 family glycosyltransferase
MQVGVEGLFEVVVTDDGSTDGTVNLVRRFAASAKFPLVFTTHQHRAYHLSRCRNEGVVFSSAPYLLFSDADCIFPPDHLFQHLRARRPNYAWSGDSVHLDEPSTLRIDHQAIRSGSFLDWITKRELTRIRRRWMKDQIYQVIGHPKKPKLTGSNIALWRVDLDTINGFDERFVGWGCEDDDLADRLRAAGVRIASILGSTQVYHMWHPSEPSRPKRWSDGTNVAYLLRDDKPYRCVDGLSDRTSLRYRSRTETQPMSTGRNVPSRAAA